MPQYKTAAEETLAIAAALGSTETADTEAHAIDLVREALASESGTERSETVAEAIHRIAPYIGTGGGAELGELVNMPYRFFTPPEIGDSFGNYSSSDYSIRIDELSAGTQVIAKHVLGVKHTDGDGNVVFPQICGNTTIKTTVTNPNISSLTDMAFYVVALALESEDTHVTSMREQSVGQQYDADTLVVTFTMPQLADNEVLGIYYPDR